MNTGNQILYVSYCCLVLHCSDQGYKTEFQGRNFSSLSIDYEFV